MQNPADAHRLAERLMGAAVGWGALAASSLIMTVLGFAVAAGLSHVA